MKRAKELLEMNEVIKEARSLNVMKVTAPPKKPKKKKKKKTKK